MISFSETLLRLSAALLLGSVIGFERESDEQSAGLRTNALVSLGCALFTIISAYGFLGFTDLAHVQIDPTRIASYIVAGIGFLGGGTIFVQKDPQKVKGLTTAAAIWVVAAIGVACGIGMFWEAIIVTVLVLIVLSILSCYGADAIPSGQTDTQGNVVNSYWREHVSSTGTFIGASGWFNAWNDLVYQNNMGAKATPPKR